MEQSHDYIKKYKECLDDAEEKDDEIVIDDDDDERTNKNKKPRKKAYREIFDMKELKKNKNKKK